MNRADNWLTKIKPIDKIFKNVIVNNTGPRDKPINDIIQEEGAHLGGPPIAFNELKGESPDVPD